MIVLQGVLSGLLQSVPSFVSALHTKKHQQACVVALIAARRMSFIMIMSLKTFLSRYFHLLDHTQSLNFEDALVGQDDLTRLSFGRDDVRDELEAVPAVREAEGSHSPCS